VVGTRPSCWKIRDPTSAILIRYNGCMIGGGAQSRPRFARERGLCPRNLRVRARAGAARARKRKFLNAREHGRAIAPLTRTVSRAVLQ